MPLPKSVNMRGTGGAVPFVNDRGEVRDRERERERERGGREVSFCR